MEERERRHLERRCPRLLEDRLGAERAVVGEDQIDVLAPSEGAVDLQAPDRREVSLLQAQSVGVELAERRVGDGGGREAVPPRGARLDHPRRLIFEPGLVGRDLPRLGGPDASEVLLALPSLPRELVVVPDVDAGPAGAGVQEVRIGEIAAVERAVVLDRGRDVEVGDLLAVRIADDVAQAPVVHPLGPVLRIPDGLVDEVPEMEHEAQPFGLGALLVLEDHPPVGVASALGDVLAAHERETDGVVVAGGGSGERAADAAAEALLVGEAVPVDAPGTEARGEHPAGPVRLGGDRDLRPCGDVVEARIFGDLQVKDLRRPARPVRRGGPAGPEQHAVRLGIAGGHALGIEVSPLGPRGLRGTGEDRGPGEHGSQRRRALDRLPSGDRSHAGSPFREAPRKVRTETSPGLCCPEIPYPVLNDPRPRRQAPGSARPPTPDGRSGLCP
jgi:hypothetical protein